MKRRVAVLGQWHQGVVAAACLAKWGHDVVGADISPSAIGGLSSARAPLFEPGLDDLLAEQAASGRLKFTTDVASAVQDRQLVMLSVDVLVDADDASDLSGVFALADLAAGGLCEGAVVLVTAQVPIGTCDAIKQRIAGARPGLAFGIAYIPENLRLGQAIDRFLKPPLPVLGTADDKSFELIEEIFAPAEVAWQRCDVRTAEMVKHALNTYLATCVGFANEIGAVCVAAGADGRRVGELLRLEPRVGRSAPLLPGLGFSGGTLARDVQTVRGLADRAGVDTPFFDGLWRSNQEQNKNVVRQLTTLLGGSLSGRRLSVLGLTYKPDTSTLRRSAALEVIAEALDRGASVSAHDPKADRSEIPRHPKLTVHDDALSAIDRADALVLMTPWAEYRSLDLPEVRRRLAGKIVFDTAGLWTESAATNAGLEYVAIGRGRAAASKPAGSPA